MKTEKRYFDVEENSPELDISSLIDVCFLLILYFLVTTSITAPEQEIAVTLPSVATAGDVEEVPALCISIDSESRVVAGCGPELLMLDRDLETRAVPLLSERVRIYKSSVELSGGNPKVQLTISDLASQQRVIDVLSCFSELQLSDVQITNL